MNFLTGITSSGWDKSNYLWWDLRQRNLEDKQELQVNGEAGCVIIGAYLNQDCSDLCRQSMLSLNSHDHSIDVIIVTNLTLSWRKGGSDNVASKIVGISEIGA